MTRVLHLTLKKKWFDMILSGEKKEEYREIKNFWLTRLCNYRFDNSGKRFTTIKEYDYVIFRNGYNPTDPSFRIKCKGIRQEEGKPEWGAEPGKKYFVIELGEIL